LSINDCPGFSKLESSSEEWRKGGEYFYLRLPFLRFEPFHSVSVQLPLDHHWHDYYDGRCAVLEEDGRTVAGYADGY
jgi:hypothetical protein